MLRAGPGSVNPYTRPVSRRERLVLLAVLAAGAFLAGLELLVTAVALPAILADFGSWTELRRASWVVTGYLLVSVVAMLVAGRLADVRGVRGVFLAALAVFIAGSLAAGAASSLDALIVGRALQAVGGGALVPVATAGAAHLATGRTRARGIALVGGVTFLGLAVGPFVGAAVLDALDPEGALAVAGFAAGPARDLLAPAWRWIFYLNVPVGIAALALGWAASAGWETPRRSIGPDLPGALLASGALTMTLIGVTLLDDQLDERFLDPTYPPVALVLAGFLLAVVGGLLARHRADPFLDPRLFREPVVRAALLVALLTGYALATAIAGGAVFVDRVLYAGPETQRLVLGALGGAAAVGALAAGPVLDRRSPGLVTAAGLVLAAASLAWMATWTAATTPATLAIGSALFGLGFGLTLTSRSTAAVEAAGEGAYGSTSAALTVARTAGMAIGVALLTAYGSTTIERLTAAVFATPEAFRAYLPAELAGRPLADPLVVDALEAWAAREAAAVVGGLFGVAAVVTLAALVPAIALGRGPWRRGPTGAAPAESVRGRPEVQSPVDPPHGSVGAPSGGSDGPIS